MYTAPVKMKEIDSEYRKALVEKLFDTDKGVYVYYDMENMDKLSKEDIQEYIDLYERQKKETIPQMNIWVQLVIWNTESVFLRKEKMIRFSG